MLRKSFIINKVTSDSGWSISWDDEKFRYKDRVHNIYIGAEKLAGSYKWAIYKSFVKNKDENGENVDESIRELVISRLKEVAVFAGLSLEF